MKWKKKKEIFEAKVDALEYRHDPNDPWTEKGHYQASLGQEFPEEAAMMHQNAPWAKE